MRSPAAKGAVRDIQVAFLHPGVIQAVQLCQVLRFREGSFPEESVHGLVIPFLFAFTLRIVGLRVEKADPHLAAGPFHPVGTELFAVIKVNTIRRAVFQEQCCDLLRF